MNRTRTTSTGLVVAGTALFAVTATRDLAYNPTALRVKPVVSEFTWPLVGLLVVVAVGFVVVSNRRIRGVLAAGGGLVAVVQLARWTVLDSSRYVEPTAMAYLAMTGGLLVALGGVVALLAPRIAGGAGPSGEATG